MSDLSEFRRNTGHGPKCSMWLLRDKLDENQREKLREALGETSISVQAIVNVLTSWGHPIGNQVVYRHRIGICSCARREAQEAK